MKLEEILLSENFIMNTYGFRDIAFVRGEGTKIWDAGGKEYLDLVSGIGVNLLGHRHPRVIEAVEEQIRKLLHVSNLYCTEPQAELARILIENSFAQKVFFSNSGAEANEAAIKLARRFGSTRKSGEERFEIIAMKNSFHGRTLATLSATGQRRLREGFGPLVPGFIFVPVNDIKALEEAVTDRTIAVMIEPIQGEGGDIVVSVDYLRKARQLCDERKLLLILDEVQTGLGRTGKLFAYQHYGIEPDIMSLAKPLGGGLPLGATLSTADVSSSFQPGTHASTFGGNPVSCSAGAAVLRVILEDNLSEKAEQLGEYLFEGLNKLKEKFSSVVEVRGKGLMVGIELSFPGKEIVKECAGKGVLLNCTAESFIRFLPPLIITKEELDLGLEVLEDVIKKR